MRSKQHVLILSVLVIALLSMSGCKGGSKPAADSGSKPATTATDAQSPQGTVKDRSAVENLKAMPEPVGTKFPDAASAAAVLSYTPKTPSDVSVVSVFVDERRPKENREAVMTLENGVRITSSLTEERAISSETEGTSGGAEDPNAMVPRLEQTKEPPDYEKMVEFFAQEKEKGIFPGEVPALAEVNGRKGVAGTRVVGEVSVHYIDWHDGTAFYQLEYIGTDLSAEQLLQLANSLS